jgi:Arc/MetJ family transcription regulator
VQSKHRAYTLGAVGMRTNIVIDDELMKEARSLAPASKRSGP